MLKVKMMYGPEAASSHWVHLAGLPRPELTRGPLWSPLPLNIYIIIIN